METNHRQIFILRGIPGSGKTTFAKNLVSKGFKRISKDDLRTMINSYSLNNSDESMIDVIQEEILKDMIFYGHNIVVDNTHAKQKYLNAILEKIKKYTRVMKWEYEVKIHVIDTPLKECIRRNSLRETPVPEEVIQKMHRQLFN